VTARILDLHGTADYRFILVQESSWQPFQQSEHHVNVWSLQTSELMSVHVPLPTFANISYTHSVGGAWQWSHTTLETEHDTQVRYGL